MEITYRNRKLGILILGYFLTLDVVLSEITVCQNNDRILLGSNKDSAYIVQVTTGDNVNLQCDFWGNNSNHLEPMVWFRRERGNSKPAKEITIEEFEKINIVEDTLTLKNFSSEDSAIYFCQLMNQNEDDLFIFVLDGVSENKIMPITGKLQQWKEYKSKYLDVINNAFETSKKEPFAYLRNSLQFSFKLITSWENWSPCIFQNNRLHKGFRKKIGKCLLHPIPCGSSNNMLISFPNSAINFTAYFVIDSYDISCRSIQLNTMLPEISAITKIIPYFDIVESCHSSQNKSGSMLRNKDTESKYNSTNKIHENGHFTLICPEATLDSEIKWFKDELLLNDSYKNNMAKNEKEPHITIDALNSLYILHATKQEEGVYACSVDGKRIKMWIILVVAKSKQLNNDFIRYSIFLGFVLSLTMTCYCTGMCVAWHRRGSFVDPLNRNKRKPTSCTPLT